MLRTVSEREENRLEEHGEKGRAAGNLARNRKRASWNSGKKKAEPKASRIERECVEKRRRRRRRRSSGVGRCAPESARYSLFKAKLEGGGTVARSVGRSAARPRGTRASFSRTISSGASGRSTSRLQASIDRWIDRAAASLFLPPDPSRSRPIVRSVCRRSSIVDRSVSIVGRSRRFEGQRRSRIVGDTCPGESFRSKARSFSFVAMLVLVASSMVQVNRVRATIRAYVRSRGSWEIPRVYRISRTCRYRFRIGRDPSEKGAYAALPNAGASTFFRSSSLLIFLFSFFFLFGFLVRSFFPRDAQRSFYQRGVPISKRACRFRWELDGKDGIWYPPR